MTLYSLRIKQKPALSKAPPLISTSPFLPDKRPPMTERFWPAYRGCTERVFMSSASPFNVRGLKTPPWDHANTAIFCTWNPWRNKKLNCTNMHFSSHKYSWLLLEFIKYMYLPIPLSINCYFLYITLEASVSGFWLEAMLPSLSEGQSCRLQPFIGKKSLTGCGGSCL